MSGKSYSIRQVLQSKSWFKSFVLFLEFEIPVAANSQNAKPGLAPHAAGYVTPDFLSLVMLMEFANPKHGTVCMMTGTPVEFQV